MAQAIRSQTAPEDSGRGLDLRKLGMWTFLGSEVFFFGALIATHLSMRGVGVAPGEFAEGHFRNFVNRIKNFLGDRLFIKAQLFRPAVEDSDPWNPVPNVVAAVDDHPAFPEELPLLDSRLVG